MVAIANQHARLKKTLLEEETSIAVSFLHLHLNTVPKI
jgi:hypothetical protein